MRVRYFSSSKRLFSLLLCAHGIVVQKRGSTKSRCGGGPLNAQSCWQQGLFTKGLLRLLLSLFPGSDYTHSRPCTRSGQCRQQHHWGKEKKMFLFFVPNNNTAANLHQPNSFANMSSLPVLASLVPVDSLSNLKRRGEKEGIGSGQRCRVSGGFSRRDSLFGGSVSPYFCCGKNRGGKNAQFPIR